MVAVIVALPPPTAVTLPFSSTVATVSSLDDHVTSQSSGSVVATSVSVVFSAKVTSVLFNVIVSVASTTVTSHVAVTSCNVLTVMVAVPLDTAVTFPLASTFATASLLDVQINVLFAGFTVAVSFTVPPTCTLLVSSTEIVTLLFFMYTVSVSTVAPFTRAIHDLDGTVTCPFVTVFNAFVPALSLSIHTCQSFPCGAPPL